jgi:hypothetical protein
MDGKRDAPRLSMSHLPARNICWPFGPLAASGSGLTLARFDWATIGESTTCDLTCVTFPPLASDGATRNAAEMPRTTAVRFMICSSLVRSLMARR